MKQIFILLFLFTSLNLFSQKKIIDNTAYANWSVISKSKLSTNNNYFAYTKKPYEGNDTTFLIDLNDENKELLKIGRANQLKFNQKSTFFTMLIHADYAHERKLKINKTKDEKMPKDTLLIYDLTTKNKLLIPNVSSYKILDSTNLIAVQLTHDFHLNKNGEISKKDEKTLKKGYKTKRKTFLIIDSQKGMLYQNNKTTFFYSDQEQENIYLLNEITKKKNTYTKIEKLDLSSFKSYDIPYQFKEVNNAYFSSKERTNLVLGKIFKEKSKQKKNIIYRFDDDFKTIDSLKLPASLDSNYTFSKDAGLKYLEKQNKWLLGIQYHEPEKPKDSLLPDEVVKLDIWSWKDAKIQPEQLKEAKNHYKKKFKILVDLKTDSIIVLEDDTLSVSAPTKDVNFILGRSSIRYDSIRSYAYPWYADFYRVNLQTGEKELILEKSFGKVILTPDGNFVYYENIKDTNFYVKNITTQEENCVTCLIKERWLDDLNGMDFIPNMEGQMMIDANRTDIWFNSTKALYIYQTKENQLKRITPDEWLNQDVRLKYMKIVSDSVYFNPSNIIINVFDKETNCNHYYTLNEENQLTEILNGYYDAFNFIKDSINNRFIARIQTNEIYPDFNIIEKGEYQPITNINPQQKEYNWSTVEPVKWTAYDGQELSGLLYKPEDFDSTKTYPMIVYYYEMNSENIHRYVSPHPTPSIVLSTEYASNGYFIFIPDIRYEIGHPAKGAYNAIMSGTDALLKKYPQIDSTRMGLQGQSWGGYQTAQLITMTNRYAAAMAGAPVSNMFSAYGGIRWGSGLSRQFQYEHSQSRIGGSIWDTHDLYIENSPIFHLPNVKTPLLIMHNDADGAVPWYQGIELYMGLRRLNQPVWLLNYNGDDHNLMKKGNRKDLSKRMKQFFDFYLNHSEEPDWMKNGVPAYKKGE